MNKTKIRYLITAVVGGAIGLFSFMNIAHAETNITIFNIDKNLNWVKSGSPYILSNDITIDNQQTLTIGPGVEIISNPLNENPTGITVNTGGAIIVNGKGNDRVEFNDISSIYIDQGSFASFKNVDIDGGNGIHFNYAKGIIATSTIKNTGYAVDILESDVSIWGSRFEFNDRGINVNSDLPVRLVDGEQGLEIGGAGNALDESTTTNPTVNINNSVIADNSAYGVSNYSYTMIQASNNWWGNESGPVFTGANKNRGIINSTPWLTSEPILDSGDNIECCSSILFIPGLEGSRLYKDSSLPLIGKTNNQLWEPNRNADVEKLFLNSQGSSIDQSIYSGEPIDKALGVVDIYNKFMKYLNDLANNGIINEWKAFGYDWRKPVADLVLGQEKKATTSVSLLDMVSDLASRSRTGKVTLIAHSNGGLIAKYLVKTLKDLNKESLIDSVISVAVPYLGAPQAISSLLHGDDQSMFGGLILKDSVARNLGINMPSAYSLLPSLEYFKKVFSPTIVFASTTMLGINDGSYSKEINTYNEQNEFIVNSNSNRLNASSSDTTLPIKGNQFLITATSILHNLIDPFAWPETIARFAIVGWNSPTTKALIYDKGIFCQGVLRTVCDKVKHHTDTTMMGDGTVVTPSAVYNAGTVVSVDLKSVSDQENKNISHANILEASSTETAVDAIITHNPADNNQAIIDKLKIIPNISIGVPDYSNGDSSFLVLSTHSPVELNVYDSKGRHTGIIPIPVNNESPIEEGLYTFTESNIPGSKFQSIGTEEEPEYQVYLPDEKSEQYKVEIIGTGVGEFTFNVDRMEHGTYIDRIEYANIPVTPLTIASTTVFAKGSDNTQTLKLDSPATLLNVDLDGNGSVDIKAKTQIEFDSIAYLEAMKVTIKTIAGNIKKGKDIIKKIDKIESLINNNKLRKADKKIINLNKRVHNIKLKKITDSSRQQILDMIELFIAQYK